MSQLRCQKIKYFGFFALEQKILIRSKTLQKNCHSFKKNPVKNLLRKPLFNTGVNLFGMESSNLEALDNLKHVLAFPIILKVKSEIFPKIYILELKPISDPLLKRGKLT